MCRLYGFRSNEPTKVDCSLIYAQNALMRQSRGDLRGEAHADGWGIAFYENSLPRVEKRTEAAYQDLHFSYTAERVYARAVLAHVRQATVGAPAAENAHPFTHGPWSFAHNGTVRALERVVPRLERETGPELLELRRGVTDSELAFLWLLSRMRRAGLDLEQHCADLDALRGVFTESIRELDERCRREGADEPARLNFVLTDGRVLLASRLRNGLHWVMREGLHDCEICGVPHTHHEEGRLYRAAAIASEPITHEEWREVPEGAVLSIDEALRTELHLE